MGLKIKKLSILLHFLFDEAKLYVFLHLIAPFYEGIFSVEKVDSRIQAQRAFVVLFEDLKLIYWHWLKY
jgi:hypothetical protein